MKWICSADAHFTEPGDLWTSRMPASMKDQAPRYEIRDDLLCASVYGREFWKIPASAMLEVAGTNASTTDIPGRLAMLDEDGIWAEILIGNLGGQWVLPFEDPEFAMATARAYNDFLAETFGPYSHREIALGMVPLRDVDLAVKEIERIASLGLKGLTLPLTPPEPYYLDKWEPIWAAAAAHKLPLTFHAATGGDFAKRLEPGTMTEMFAGSDRERTAKKTNFGMKYQTDSFNVLSHLIGAGVLERYPSLHVLFIETNAAWLATAMEAMDAEWEVRAAQELVEGKISYSVDADGNEVGRPTAAIAGGGWPYPLAPSEYVRRQVHATFQNETAALKFRKAIGASSLLWGSDFPHPEGTWPNTKKVVDELFADVEEPDRQAILSGNMAALFGIEVPA